jgi:hypothetical protein
MPIEQIINSEVAFDAYIGHLRAQFDKHHYLRITVKTGKQRTPTQNNCMWKYCTMLADSLNEGGIDFRQALKPGVDVPFNKDLVNEYLWDVFQEAITGHKSSTKPDRSQYSEIYDRVNAFTINRWGISVPWPSKDTMKDVASTP